MTPEFELVNNILGYGDPGNDQERGVWFLGIEEADRWGKTVEEVRRRYAAVEKHLINDFVAGEENRGKFRGQIEQYISKIVCPFSPEIHRRFINGALVNRALCSEQAEIWKFYREKLLWRQGSGICNANLYPLGRAGTSEWPPENREIFGFGSSDVDLYKRHVRETRFLRMRNCWAKCHPQATICYVGENYREDVSELFRLETSEWHRLSEEANIWCQDAKRILLTGHFSRRPWSSAMAEVVIRQLRKWGVILPR